MPDSPKTEMRLVGTWELVSLQWIYPNGHEVEPWGKPAGRISYDAAGNVVAMLMHERRNQADGRAVDPTTSSSYSAYFGTYQVDVAEGVVVHHVAGSLNGDMASGELRRTYAFEGGMLVLGFTLARDGITRRLVWRQISSPVATKA